VLEDNNYKTRDFRLWIIDNPIKEINGKKVGLNISAEYFYKGKKLSDVKLGVSLAKREGGQEDIAYYIRRYPKEYFAC
jgi:hypothetical protein